MWAGQRPVDVRALGEPSGAPAWKTIPSWYLVARKRAGARVVEVGASHVDASAHLRRPVRCHGKRHTIAKSPIRNPKLTLFGSAARLGRTYDSSPVLSETDLHES